MKVDLDSQTEYSEEEELEEAILEPEPVTIDAADKEGQRVSVKDRINRARARLRRLETQNPRTPPRTPQRREM